MPAASGGPQALILQDSGRRLACCVIYQRVTARRITFADPVGRYEVLAGLEYKAVCMLATCGHTLQLAVRDHATNHVTTLVPPHPVPTCPSTWSWTRGRSRTDAKNGSAGSGEAQAAGRIRRMSTGRPSRFWADRKSVA